MTCTEKIRVYTLRTVEQVTMQYAQSTKNGLGQYSVFTTSNIVMSSLNEMKYPH